MHKPFTQIFSEFEGKEYEDEDLLGDVKYHLGYSCEVASRGGGKVNLTLAPNPSHLEAVDPVVEGISRAKIDHTYQGDNGKVASILIHGDASISGQGIIYELVQMADLDGYKTGGTITLNSANTVTTLAGNLSGGATLAGFTNNGALSIGTVAAAGTGEPQESEFVSGVGGAG